MTGKLFTLPGAQDALALTEQRLREIVREEIEWALKLKSPLPAEPTVKRAGRRGSPNKLTPQRLNHYRQIANHYEAGATILETALKLGCSPSTVNKALDICGLSVRPHSGKPRGKLSDRTEEMKALYAEGKSLVEIGARYAITRERVRQILIGAGITDTHHRLPTPEERAAADRYAAGDSLDLAAESLGVHPTTMRRIILRCGHEIRAGARKRHEITMERSAVAARLYGEGKTCREIAAAIGLSKPEMVYRLLSIAGVKPNRNAGAGRLS